MLNNIRSDSLHIHIQHRTINFIKNCCSTCTHTIKAYVDIYIYSMKMTFTMYVVNTREPAFYLQLYGEAVILSLLQCIDSYVQSVQYIEKERAVDLLIWNIRCAFNVAATSKSLGQCEIFVKNPKIFLYWIDSIYLRKHDFPCRMKFDDK